jgi:phenylalanyl-tRNA synthetase beta chain
MLADMGGEIYQMKLNYRKQEITPNLDPEKMKISLESANKLLGVQIREKDLKGLAEKMGYGYENGEVLIPAWRVDVLHEVDIIEDIAIAYGYDKFREEIPAVATTGKEDKKERIKGKIADILAGLGMIEISSHHLLIKDEAKKMGQKNFIEVEKSRTEYSVLRESLLCLALKALSRNVDAEYPQKIFEMGRVFAKDEKLETGIKETEKLCIAITPANFTEIKQILDYLLHALALEYRIEEAVFPNYIDGRTAKIILGGKEMGILGEIHPSVLKGWHLKMPLACLEIELDGLIEKF